MFSDWMTMNDALGKMWKEAVTYFKVLSQHFSRGAEKSYEKYQSRYTVSGLIFEPTISHVGSGSPNQSSAMNE